MADNPEAGISAESAVARVNGRRAKRNLPKIRAGKSAASGAAPRHRHAASESIA